ncbi:unnamed protein product [Prorocentrum cordatum]|uniref:Uncharacterized protein n=1 Tax=Prorocentrum cordatum TaxID=2364126 RepID=A0ABN9QE09_9DINO|nr:unnamed protein product [Polarella glacialis]
MGRLAARLARTPAIPPENVAGSPPPRAMPSLVLQASFDGVSRRRKHGTDINFRRSQRTRLGVARTCTFFSGGTPEQHPGSSGKHALARPTNARRMGVRAMERGGQGIDTATLPSHHGRIRPPRSQVRTHSSRGPRSGRMGIFLFPFSRLPWMGAGPPAWRAQRDRGGAGGAARGVLVLDVRARLLAGRLSRLLGVTVSAADAVLPGGQLLSRAGAAETCAGAFGSTASG